MPEINKDPYELEGICPGCDNEIELKADGTPKCPCFTPFTCEAEVCDYILDTIHAHAKTLPPTELNDAKYCRAIAHVEDWKASL